MSTGESEANALIQGLQDAFRIRNDARMPSFFGGNQDPMEWLEEFNRSAKINQYTDEYKLQVVSGYLQGTAGQWFSEAQEGQNPINHWNDRNQTSFETSFLATFRTTVLINQWRFELQMKVQKLGETVEQYANDIKKLIKRIDGNNRWTEDEKVWQFLKGLRKDIAYQARPFIMSQERPTLEKAIQTAKQFEENAQTYPEAATGYTTMTSMNMQGSVPLRNKNNDNDDAIERIVQKAFAPIAETLQKLIEKGERPNNTFNSRPNYNNNNRGQGYNSYNGNRGQNYRSYNNPPHCFACGQTGHLAWNCSTRQVNQGNQRSQANSTIPTVPRPTNTVPPQANTTANLNIQQVSQGAANSNTFITQEDEIQQPVSTVWERIQHLN